MQETQTQPNQVNSIIHKILTKRNIEGSTLSDYFSWDLRELPDLSKMHDLKKSANRIIEAINKNEKIGIYGDYDVDGTTSCAVFYQFFKLLNVEVELFQPSRFVEGYGIHNSSIDKALDVGCKLLITVDCGITNLETAEYSQSNNLDLIITDHHKDSREHIPKAYAVVNPNRRDEPKDSPLVALAGVGVAFAVCLEIKKILEETGKELPSIYPLLQYVAVGTICDLAKLNPMNLKLSRHGLKQLPKTQYPGLEAFFNPEDKSNDVMPSERISFWVGPMINSKGRLDHPERALNLITAKDKLTAQENFVHLEVSNRERKLIQAEVFDEAKKQMIKNLSYGEKLASIVYSPNWHEGVIGIVASKLVETFEMPAIVFSDAEEKGIIKASARSAGTLNLHTLLDSMNELFIKFGGHSAAAGLSMKKENLPIFKERMEKALANTPAIERTVQDFYDLEISFQDISFDLVNALSKMEPFGMGNEKPVFRMKNAKIASYTLLKDIHVKWFFTSDDFPGQTFQGISFNFIGKWNTVMPDDLFKRQESEGLTVQFTVGINKFRGNETIQLMVDKIFPGII